MKAIRLTPFLLALSLLTASPAAAQPSCRVPGGRILQSSSVAHLISVPTLDGSALYACIRRSGRKILLDDGYSDAHLMGRWVAWQQPGHRGHWRIVVHDLRTARERLVDGHVASHSLGLTARGTIVWAQQPDSGDATPLYVNDTEVGGQLLDPGAVDAASVHLAGRRVSWISSGVRRSAIVH